MSRIEPALMVSGICCDSCKSVYVLAPTDEPRGYEKTGREQLAALVWPETEAGGWRVTSAGERRCPACVERRGTGPLPERPGWRELMQGPRSSGHGD